MRSVGRVELLRDLERPTGRVLLVDGVEQSYVDDADPAHLEFEYMQHMALVLDLVRPAPGPLAAVHLGGGAMTMPRWLAATRPGSRNVVVEASADVVRVLAELPATNGCELVVADALDALATMPSATSDVVVWDLYDGPRAVTSALTIDAVTDMTRLLRAGGLVLLNVSDATPFDVVRPVLAAVRLCVDDLALLAQPSTLRGRRSGNCVVAGIVGGALPGAALSRAGAAAPVRARVLVGDELQAFIGSAKPATVESPLPLPDAALGRGFL